MHYRLKNIKFDDIERGTMIENFLVPANAADIKEWLKDYDSERTFTDDEALKMYIRVAMFNKYSVTYDSEQLNYHEHESLIKNYEATIQDYDVNIYDDSSYEMTVANVRVNWPHDVIAYVNFDCIKYVDSHDIKDEAIGQEIYEWLMENLQIEISFAGHNVTERLIKFIAEYMIHENAAAPNTISEDVYEYLLEEGFNEETAEKVSSGAFEFASSLVLDVGEYL